MAWRNRYAPRRRRPKPSRNIGMGILPMGKSGPPQGIAEAVARPYQEPVEPQRGRPPGVLASATGQEGFAEMVTGLMQAQGDRQDAEIERRSRAIEARLQREHDITLGALGQESHIQGLQEQSRLKMLEHERALAFKEQDGELDPYIDLHYKGKIDRGDMTPQDWVTLERFRREARGKSTTEGGAPAPTGWQGAQPATPDERVAERVRRMGPPRRSSIDDVSIVIDTALEAGNLGKEQIKAAAYPGGIPHYSDVVLSNPGFQSWRDLVLQSHTPEEVADATREALTAYMMHERVDPMAAAWEGQHLWDRVLAKGYEKPKE